MSNTYRHNVEAKFNQAEYGTEEWHLRLKEWEALFSKGWYGTCPKEWNKLHHIKPHRTKERQVLNTIDLDNMGEETIFPLYRKPHIYYW